MKTATLLALTAKLAPYKAEIALAGAFLLVAVLAVLAIHLSTATMRVYPVAALAIASFLLGFLGPKPTLPPL